MTRSSVEEGAAVCAAICFPNPDVDRRDLRSDRCKSAAHEGYEGQSRSHVVILCEKLFVYLRIRLSDGQHLRVSREACVLAWAHQGNHLRLPLESEFESNSEVRRGTPTPRRTKFYFQYERDSARGQKEDEDSSSARPRTSS